MPPPPSDNPSEPFIPKLNDLVEAARLRSFCLLNLLSRCWSIVISDQLIFAFGSFWYWAIPTDTIY